jgi:hypothetical protein
MKFLNKYELMEPVTGGAVETFVAREIASGERVIVHMFAGSEVLPDKPALQWALQSLRGLAPTPMGSVIEGGRYEQTNHAYLVTKFPADPVALQHWIKFYTLQAQSTQPTLGTPVPLPSTVRLKPAQSGSEKTNQQPVGEFTKAFFGSATADVDSQSSSSSHTPSEREAVPDPADHWSRKPASAFTKEFLSGFDLGPEINKSPEPASLPKERRKPQSFTAEFLMPGGEERKTEQKPVEPGKKDSISSLFDMPTSLNTKPSQRPAESQKKADDGLDFSAPAAKSGTGEFTQFFRGPFGGQSTAGAPADIPPIPPARPRERAGEFTQLFGSSAKSVPGKETGALLEPAAPNQSGNFGELFGTPTTRGPNAGSDVAGRGSSAREGQISWDEPATSRPVTTDQSFAGSAADRPGTFREPGAPLGSSAPPQAGSGESTALFANEIVWDRPAPPRPTPPDRSIGENPRKAVPAAEPAASAPLSGTKSGATSVFTPPGSRPSAEPLPAPSGPSEYTRIISPPNPPASEPEVKPAAAAPAAPGFSFPQVAIPPMAMPHAPTPVMPHAQVPQAPHMQIPQPHIQMPQPVPMHVPMPAMQAPQAPPSPQAAPAAGPVPQKFPYWPLIIVMNVLLIVAVALILYFALKH